MCFAIPKWFPIDSHWLAGVLFLMSAQLMSLYLVFPSRADEGLSKCTAPTGLPSWSQASLSRLEENANKHLQLVALVGPESDDDNPLGQLRKYLQQERANRPPLQEQAFATRPLSQAEAQQARQLLIEDHLQHIRATRQAEHQAKQIELGELAMKYDFKVFGERPPEGHSLTISMHGGGGAPKRVNDRQWENQKRLYQLDEGIYLAPRAPTDSWNMWHQGHIDRFYTRLIENMIAFEGIDPNRVYLTGYSAGGDGVYQLAPRMADQLAAAAMMAGHPNETQPDGLRNLPFTLHVGGEDKAYNRNQIARQWKQQLAELQQQEPDGYQHWVKVHEGKGHWMDGEDAEGVAWMSSFERNLHPKKVVWLQDDVLHQRFYWLALHEQHAVARQRIVVSREGNTFDIEHCDAPQLTILLDNSMVDFDQPVEVHWDGKIAIKSKPIRTIDAIYGTLVDRGDPTAVFPARLEVSRPDPARESLMGDE